MYIVLFVVALNVSVADTIIGWAKTSSPLLAVLKDAVAKAFNVNWPLPDTLNLSAV